ncbi:MAG TPA: hypothetical protein VMW75_20330 [Thermoanaerobaculia bacterium]|nr:hypothetical protein [Thermoanaerobaculia bacterium]
MTHYPILFSRRDVVKARDYTAGVIVAGRILVTEEDGEFWAEGVNPGGMAAEGDSTETALCALCDSYHKVLLDIAEDAPSFESFKKAVERFFADTNMTALKEWEEAVLQVRAGKLTLDSMGKRPSESPIGIRVLPLDKGNARQEEEEVSDAAMAA